MLLREFGLMAEGVPLIIITYHETGNKEVDFVSKSAFMTSILKFAENLIQPVESFESKKYQFLFKVGNIKNNLGSNSQLIAYIVIDKDKNFTENLRDKLKKQLEDILDKFISQYGGLDCSDSSKFEEFVKVIEKYLGLHTKTTDEKVSNLFL